MTPGYVILKPDFPECITDFGFFWYEDEYTVDAAATWVLQANAANAIVMHAAAPGARRRTDLHSTPDLRFHRATPHNAALGAPPLEQLTSPHRHALTPTASRTNSVILRDRPSHKRRTADIYASVERVDHTSRRVHHSNTR